MTLAVKSSGQATAPGFPGAPSDMCILSLTDTLPPFPMYAAFPRPEYYGGSAPLRAFSRRRAYPRPPRRRAGPAEGRP
ncbi:MAG TPA: hypothetical protein VGA04_23990, partial [Streptosporangiaceae bacterium]